MIVLGYGDVAPRTAGGKFIGIIRLYILFISEKVHTHNLSKGFVTASNFFGLLYFESF